jgi:predicted nucleic acid-binding protein
MAKAVARILLEAREVEFVPCSEFFQEILETFRTQKETALSFTDAAIVTVARRQKGSEIVTFDSDFRRVEGISVIP